MTARLASLITAVLGVATGLYLLFGETGTRCYTATIGQSGPGQPVSTIAPGHCESTRMIDVQSVWPMPLLVLAVWSLAPLLAVVGVWSTPVRSILVLAALVIEATSIISFGAGPYYIPFVLVPLTLTWILARRAARMG
ncbi:MAG: hypothetical protein M3Q61_03885 [Chloroflexota bacterium]|nr:hypothetical protein [Chloroflexota bacterium]